MYYYLYESLVNLYLKIEQILELKILNPGNICARIKMRSLIVLSYLK